MSQRLTVTDLINDRTKINRAAHAALAAFRSSKPWQGTFEERYAKFQSLMDALNDAYGLGASFTFHGRENPKKLGNGAYDRRSNVIILVGKLSVVTFLNCFAAARGMKRRECFVWSLSVFKRMFPLSYSRCHAVGVNLVR